jgi:hypothetical protein
MKSMYPSKTIPYSAVVRPNVVFANQYFKSNFILDGDARAHQTSASGKRPLESRVNLRIIHDELLQATFSDRSNRARHFAGVV